MRRVFIKTSFAALIILALLFAVTVTTYANEDEILNDFKNLIDEMPDDVKDRLPDDMENKESIEKGVLEFTQISYILNVIKEILGVEFASSSRLFAALVGLIAILGISGAAKNSFGDSAIPMAVRFAGVSAVMLTVVQTQYECLLKVKEYFEQLNGIMLGMIPITGTVWAMGGNVSTASVGSATMYVFLNISQLVFGNTVLPMAALGTCLAFCNGISPDMELKRVSGALRKTYLFLIGAVVTVFGAILSTQTMITAASDCATARTAKFISASVIPIVGGSVGDSLRTVASGIQYIKSILGVGGIAMIFLAVLPVLISLLLTRLALSLASGIAGFFGCGEIGGLLGELSEVYSSVVAAVAMTGVMFILTLFIFIKTAVAIA